MLKKVKPTRNLIAKMIENEEFRGVKGIPCIECNCIEDDLYCCTSCWDFSVDANGNILIAQVIQALFESREDSADIFKSFNKEMFLTHWNESDYSETKVLDGEMYVGYISQTDIDDFDPEYDKVTDMFYVDLFELVTSLM